MNLYPPVRPDIAPNDRFGGNPVTYLLWHWSMDSGQDDMVTFGEGGGCAMLFLPHDGLDSHDVRTLIEYADEMHVSLTRWHWGALGDVLRDGAILYEDSNGFVSHNLFPLLMEEWSAEVGYAAQFDQEY